MYCARVCVCRSARERGCDDQTTRGLPISDTIARLLRAMYWWLSDAFMKRLWSALFAALLAASLVATAPDDCPPQVNVAVHECMAPVKRYVAGGPRAFNEAQPRHLAATPRCSTTAVATRWRRSDDSMRATTSCPTSTCVLALCPCHVMPVCYCVQTFANLGKEVFSELCQ